MLFTATGCIFRANDDRGMTPISGFVSALSPARSGAGQGGLDHAALVVELHRVGELGGGGQVLQLVLALGQQADVVVGFRAGDAGGAERVACTGLIGLFSFDAVAWLLGGSASLLSRAVYTVVGIAALCAIPSLFGSEPQARRAE